MIPYDPSTVESRLVLYQNQLRRNQLRAEDEERKRRKAQEDAQRAWAERQRVAMGRIRGETLQPASYAIPPVAPGPQSQFDLTSQRTMMPPLPVSGIRFPSGQLKQLFTAPVGEAPNQANYLEKQQALQNIMARRPSGAGSLLYTEEAERPPPYEESTSRAQSYLEKNAMEISVMDALPQSWQRAIYQNAPWAAMALAQINVMNVSMFALGLPGPRAATGINRTAEAADILAKVRQVEAATGAKILDEAALGGGRMRTIYPSTGALEAVQRIQNPLVRKALTAPAAGIAGFTEEGGLVRGVRVTGEMGAGQATLGAAGEKIGGKRGGEIGALVGGFAGPAAFSKFARTQYRNSFPGLEKMVAQRMAELTPEIKQAWLAGEYGGLGKAPEFAKESSIKAVIEKAKKAYERYKKVETVIAPSEVDALGVPVPEAPSISVKALDAYTGLANEARDSLIERLLEADPDIISVKERLGEDAARSIARTRAELAIQYEVRGEGRNLPEDRALMDEYFRRAAAGGRLPDEEGTLTEGVEKEVKEAGRQRVPGSAKWYRAIRESQTPEQNLWFGGRRQAQPPVSLVEAVLDNPNGNVTTQFINEVGSLSMGRGDYFTLEYRLNPPRVARRDGIIVNPHFAVAQENVAGPGRELVGGWNAIHQPTGTVAGTFETPTQAIAFAKAITPLHDWGSVRPAGLYGKVTIPRDVLEKMADLTVAIQTRSVTGQQVIDTLFYSKEGWIGMDEYARRIQTGMREPSPQVVPPEKRNIWNVVDMQETGRRPAGIPDDATYLGKGHSYQAFEESDYTVNASSLSEERLAQLEAKGIMPDADGNFNLHSTGFKPAEAFQVPFESLPVERQNIIHERYGSSMKEGEQYYAVRFVVDGELRPEISGPWTADEITRFALKERGQQITTSGRGGRAIEVGKAEKEWNKMLRKRREATLAKLGWSREVPEGFELIKVTEGDKIINRKTGESRMLPKDESGFAWKDLSPDRQQKLEAYLGKSGSVGRRGLLSKATMPDGSIYKPPKWTPRRREAAPDADLDAYMDELYGNAPIPEPEGAPLPPSTGEATAGLEVAAPAPPPTRVTHVLNVKKMGRPLAEVVKNPNNVYIGRKNGPVPESKWHNPFKIGPDGTREEVIAKYEAYLRGKPELMAALPELEGKNLVCFCKPQACHGDVLVKLLAEQRVAAAPAGQARVMYRGSSSLVADRPITEGAFLTSSAEDAAVYARTDANLKGGEPVVRQVEVDEGAVGPPPEEGLASARGAMVVTDAEGVREVAPTAEAPAVESLEEVPARTILAGEGARRVTGEVVPSTQAELNLASDRLKTIRAELGRKPSEVTRRGTKLVKGLSWTKSKFKGPSVERGRAKGGKGKMRYTNTHFVDTPVEVVRGPKNSRRILIFDLDHATFIVDGKVYADGSNIRFKPPEGIENHYIVIHRDTGVELGQFKTLTDARTFGNVIAKWEWAVKDADRLKATPQYADAKKLEAALQDDRMPPDVWEMIRPSMIEGGGRAGSGWQGTFTPSSLPADPELRALAIKDIMGWDGLTVDEKVARLLEINRPPDVAARLARASWKQLPKGAKAELDALGLAPQLSDLQMTASGLKVILAELQKQGITPDLSSVVPRRVLPEGILPRPEPTYVEPERPAKYDEYRALSDEELVSRLAAVGELGDYESVGGIETDFVKPEVQRRIVTAPDPQAKALELAGHIKDPTDQYGLGEWMRYIADRDVADRGRKSTVIPPGVRRVVIDTHGNGMTDSVPFEDAVWNEYGNLIEARGTHEGAIDEAIRTKGQEFGIDASRQEEYARADITDTGIQMSLDADGTIRSGTRQTGEFGRFGLESEIQWTEKEYRQRVQGAARSLIASGIAPETPITVDQFRQTTVGRLAEGKFPGIQVQTRGGPAGTTARQAVRELPERPPELQAEPGTEEAAVQQQADAIEASYPEDVTAETLEPPPPFDEVDEAAFASGEFEMPRQQTPREEPPRAEETKRAAAEGAKRAEKKGKKAVAGGKEPPKGPPRRPVHNREMSPEERRRRFLLPDQPEGLLTVEAVDHWMNFPLSESDGRLFVRKYTGALNYRISRVQAISIDIIEKAKAQGLNITEGATESNIRMRAALEAPIGTKVWRELSPAELEVVSRLRQLLDEEAAYIKAFDPKFQPWADYLPHEWKDLRTGWNPLRRRQVGAKPSFRQHRRLGGTEQDIIQEREAEIQKIKDSGDAEAWKHRPRHLQPVTWNPVSTVERRLLSGASHHVQVALRDNLVRRGLAKRIQDVDPQLNPKVEGSDPKKVWRVPKSCTILKYFQNKEGEVVREDMYVPPEIAQWLDFTFEPSMFSQHAPLRVWREIVATGKFMLTLGGLFQNVDYMMRDAAYAWEHGKIPGMTFDPTYLNASAQAWRRAYVPGAARAMARWEMLDPSPRAMARRYLIDNGLPVEAGMGFVDQELSQMFKEMHIFKIPIAGKILRRWGQGAYSEFHREMLLSIGEKETLALTKRKLARFNGEYTRDQWHEAITEASSEVGQRLSMRFSSMPFWQSVFHSATTRDILRNLIFSIAENEAWVRMPFQQKKFMLMMAVNCVVIANVANVAATGRPLARDQYIPFMKSRDGKWAGMLEIPGVPGYTYNTRFLRSMLPFRGEDGRLLYIDWVGQADTPMRLLFDPIFAAKSRTAEPVQLVGQLVGGKTWFGGEPTRTDTLNREWVKRAGKFAIMTVAPIPAKGFLQERGRIGTTASVVQAAGLNVSAEDLVRLRNRTAKADPKYRKPYDQLEHQQQLDFAVEHPEQFAKAEDFPVGSPQRKSKEIKEERTAQIADVGRRFKEDYDGQSYRENRATIITRSSGARSALDQQMMASTSPQGRAVQEWFQFLEEARKAKGRGGILTAEDYDALQEAARRYMGPQKWAMVQRYMLASADPVEREYLSDMEELEPFWQLTDTAWAQWAQRNGLGKYARMTYRQFRAQVAQAYIRAGKWPGGISNDETIKAFEKYSGDIRSRYLENNPIVDAIRVYWGYADKVHSTAAQEYLRRKAGLQAEIAEAETGGLNLKGLSGLKKVSLK